MATPEEIAKGHDGTVQTMKVKIGEAVVIINASDYDPSKHKKMEDKDAKELSAKEEKEKVK